MRCPLGEVDKRKAYLGKKGILRVKEDSRIEKHEALSANILMALSIEKRKSMLRRARSNAEQSTQRVKNLGRDSN